MGMTFHWWRHYCQSCSQPRYAILGASLAYNFAAIVGASIATLVAIEINKLYGMIGVGIYVLINGILSLIALVSMKETKDVDLMD